MHCYPPDLLLGLSFDQPILTIFRKYFNEKCYIGAANPEMTFRIRVSSIRRWEMIPLPPLVYFF